jgi:hypothetical protein
MPARKDTKILGSTRRAASKTMRDRYSPYPNMTFVESAKRASRLADQQESLLADSAVTGAGRVRVAAQKRADDARTKAKFNQSADRMMKAINTDLQAPKAKAKAKVTVKAKLTKPRK